MAQFKHASTLLFSTLFFVFVAMNANAQLSKRIQNRIKENTERKIEDKIVKKADDKTDQALDSLFKTRKRPGGVSSNKKSSGVEGNDGNGNETSGAPAFDFSKMMNAKYESSYTLDQEFKVEIRSKEKPKKKEEVANMDMHYGNGCYMMVYHDESGKTASKALMDLKNNTSIVLNDADKSAIAMSMDFMTDHMGEMAEQYKDSVVDNSDYTITKTGRTKMIAGYLSEEYLMESNDMTMNVWYTDAISVEMHENMEQYKLFGSFAQGFNNAFQGKKSGMMMESHMVEKTGNKGTFDYLVKEVIIKSNTLNMSDYTFTQLGSN